MTDDILVFTFAAQRAWNVLKMEVAIRINIRSAVVDYAEVALAKPQGNAKLKVRKISLGTAYIHLRKPRMLQG